MKNFVPEPYVISVKQEKIENFQDMQLLFAMAKFRI